MERSNKKLIKKTSLFVLALVTFLSMMSFFIAANVGVSEEGIGSVHHNVVFYKAKDGAFIDDCYIEDGNNALKMESIGDLFEVGQFYKGFGIFTGWEYEAPPDSTPMPFTFDMPVYQDLRVWPAWQTTSLKITYDLDKGLINGLDKPPVDDTDYDFSMTAQIKDAAAIRGTAIFFGWRSADGSLYYPGDEVAISSVDSLILSAEYAMAGYFFDVRYHINYLPYDKVEINKVYSYWTNFTLLDELFEVEGYQMTGWSLVPNPGEEDVSFEISERIRVMPEYKVAGIDLYAMWELVPPETPPPSEPLPPPPTTSPSEPSQPPSEPSGPPSEPPQPPYELLPATEPPQVGPPQAITTQPSKKGPTQGTIKQSPPSASTISMYTLYPSIFRPDIQTIADNDDIRIINDVGAISLLSPHQNDSFADEAIRIIEDERLPTAASGYGRSWALLNLILCLAGVLLAILMGIRILLNNRRKEYKKKNGKTHEVDRYHGRLLLMLLVPFLAIVGVILFYLTQDMSLSIVLLDWWTPLHILLLVDGLLSYIFAFKRRKHESDETTQTTVL